MLRLPLRRDRKCRAHSCNRALLSPVLHRASMTNGTFSSDPFGFLVALSLEQRDGLLAALKQFQFGTSLGQKGGQCV